MTEPSEEDRELLAALEHIVNLTENEPDEHPVSLATRLMPIRQTARDALRAIAKARALSPSPDTLGECTIGVGDGSGNLFVHGDYESVKAVQAIIFRKEELEGLATTRLAASSREGGEMRTALEKCRDKFLHYEQLHRLKCTSEGDEKADRNREMADLCIAALASPAPETEVEQVTQGDCEVCGGDCSAANPPMIYCPMRDGAQRAHEDEELKSIAEQVTQGRIEDHPLMQEIIAIRMRAACSFSPEHSGQRGQDFDRGLLAAAKAVEDHLTSRAALGSAKESGGK